MENMASASGLFAQGPQGPVYQFHSGAQVAQVAVVG